MKDKLNIEKLVYGGFGMGRIGGKAVFVPFAAPGDVLEVSITKKHKSYDEAVIADIVEPAGCRVAPECRYYGVCGGCHLQHVSYATQIQWKQIMLEEQLQRMAGVKEPNVLPVIPSPMVWGYRNRVQIHRRGSKIGYLMKESEKIVDVEECPIASKIVNKKLKESRKNWPGVSDRIEISENDEGSFSQVNTYANEELKKLVVDWASDGLCERAVELYAGSGNLTLPLADVAEEIVAVEADRKAVEKLKECVILSPSTSLRVNSAKDLPYNETKNQKIEAICSTAEEFFNLPLPRGEGKKGRVCNIDLVLLDPPREGLSGKAAAGIIKLRPPRIIYVSCNPSTLARDIKLFAKAGYVLKRAQPIDMFPQTYHIESVTELCFK